VSSRRERKKGKTKPFPEAFVRVQKLGRKGLRQPKGRSSWVSSLMERQVSLLPTGESWFLRKAWLLLPPTQPEDQNTRLWFFPVICANIQFCSSIPKTYELNARCSAEHN
jgi:hypothetical protein